MTRRFRSSALVFLFLIGLLALAPLEARAANCSNPTGVEGETIYNVDYHMLQFCNGTHWIRTAGSSDPRIGTLTNGKACTSDGAKIDCTSDAAAGGITALTGNVTASGTGSVAATIANDAVTTAKIADGAVTAPKTASGTWCGMRRLTCPWGATPTYYAPNIPCNGTTITATCIADEAGFFLGSCTCPSGYTGAALTMSDYQGCSCVKN